VDAIYTHGYLADVVVTGVGAHLAHHRAAQELLILQSIIRYHLTPHRSRRYLGHVVEAGFHGEVGHRLKIRVLGDGIRERLLNIPQLTEVQETDIRRRIQRVMTGVILTLQPPRQHLIDIGHTLTHGTQ
jgi:hypothetical protein